MTDKVLEYIRRYNMLSEGDTAVCGLSGGADSVSLLMVLYKLRDILGIKVEALHVNHCLRGAESDRDEKFCRELCKKLDIPFTAVSCDVKTYSREKSLSCEEAARELRYGIFRENTMEKKLATAHNADDNLETVILNLVRGSGLKGISGITPVRGNIIRPLLAVSREEIEGFLKALGQDYVTDSTNLSDDYTRNRIRHNIIPVMKELNTSMISTSVRSIGTLLKENELIEEMTDRAVSAHNAGKGYTGLADEPEVIRRRCIARLLSENGIPYSHQRLEEADRILLNHGQINVSGELFLVSDDKGIRLEKLNSDEPQELAIPLMIGDNSIFPGRIVRCELINCDKEKKFAPVHRNLTFYLLDYDKINDGAILRNRRFGDKIQLPGRDFKSSVRKLINETVPKELRSYLHFIEDAEGTIFAERIGIAKRVVPTADTRRLLKITVIY